MCFLGHDAGATKVRFCVGASMLAGKTLFGVPQSGEHCATETSGGLAGSGPNTRVPSGCSSSHVQQQTAGKHCVAWWDVTLEIKRKESAPIKSAFRREILFSLFVSPKGRIQVRAKVTCQHRQHINWNSLAKDLHLVIIWNVKNVFIQIWHMSKISGSAWACSVIRMKKLSYVGLPGVKCWLSNDFLYFTYKIKHYKMPRLRYIILIASNAICPVRKLR